MFLSVPQISWLSLSRSLSLSPLLSVSLLICPFPCPRPSGSVGPCLFCFNLVFSLCVSVCLSLCFCHCLSSLYFTVFLWFFSVVTLPASSLPRSCSFSLQGPGDLPRPTSAPPCSCLDQGVLRGAGTTPPRMPVTPRPLPAALSSQRWVCGFPGHWKPRSGPDLAMLAWGCLRLGYWGEGTNKTNPLWAGTCPGSRYFLAV